MRNIVMYNNSNRHFTSTGQPQLIRASLVLCIVRNMYMYYGHFMKVDRDRWATMMCKVFHIRIWAGLGLNISAHAEL